MPRSVGNGDVRKGGGATVSDTNDIANAVARTLRGGQSQLQLILVGPHGTGKSALLSTLTKAGYTLSEERVLPDNAVAVTVEQSPRKVRR